MGREALTERGGGGWGVLSDSETHQGFRPWRAVVGFAELSSGRPETGPGGSTDRVMPGASASTSRPAALMLS